MMRALAMLPLTALLWTTAALAEGKCADAQYQPPASILGDMRPYLLCGLLRDRDSHIATRLNGQAVRVTGAGEDSCDRLKQSAIETSEARLAVTIPDANARRAFVLAEFAKADQFLQAAARSDDLTIGDEAASPQCRTTDAPDQ